MQIKKKLLIFPCIFLLYGLHELFDVTCFIKCIIGVPCPGCGMTRALMKAITFNFKEAFSYHPMFWSVPILFAYFFADGVLFKNKWINMGLIGAVLLGFGVNWIFVLV